MMKRNWDETMEIVAERRANPGMDDLIDVLVHGEVDGEGLSDAEIFMGLGLLGAGGNDSTRTVFTSGMLGCSRTPTSSACCSAIRADPRRSSRSCCGCTPPSLISVAPRRADVELHGKTIAAGDKVLLWYVLVEPRRVRLRRHPAASTHARTPDHTRRRRPAAATSLARRGAGAAGDPDAALRDAPPLRPAARHRACRRADEGPLAVPESAEDAAGPLHARKRCRVAGRRSIMGGRVGVS